jgi:TrmH family RNA methyltransferase
MNAVFILVRPQHAGNLGSVARVLKNFGQKELRLVAPAARWNEEARRMAVGADVLVEKARRFGSLSAAVADLQWVAATASLRNRPGLENLTARDAIKRAVRKVRSNRIGFVFGPEDSGLTDLEISLCHELIHIPTVPASPTLNLAQAVALIAYEWFIASKLAAKSRILAPVESLEGLFRHLEKALLAIGFLHENNLEHMMKVLRRVFLRSQLSEREVTVMRGVCRQILWAARKKTEGLRD